MTLLITVFAAVIASVLWYTSEDRSMRFGTLALMYTGAALMWLVDAVAEYLEVGAEFFTPAAADMLNDTYLGLSVVALGLIIWLVIVFAKDPKGKIRAMLASKS